MRRIACVFLAGLLAAAAAAQSGPVNLDFRRGAPGQLPAGWWAPVAQAGYPASIATRCRQAGGRCAVLHAKGSTPAAPFGNLMQSFDAAPWRGRTVRFRAWVRVEPEGRARAQLWLRVDRAGGQAGFFDNMQDRPILSREWAEYEISGPVADDAVRINIGMMILGAGAAFLDGVSFEAAAPDPPRPLSPLALRNLVAFARLYGSIRYFYPGEEAAAADWDALAMAGVAAVEGAAASEDLAAKLAGWLKPVAPAARVYLAGAAPASPAEAGPAAKIVFWRHHGLGGTHPKNIYKSERVSAEAPAGGLPAPWVVKLSAAVEASIPLALAASGAPPQVPPPGARSFFPERAVRLAAVIAAWNVFQHFYPYFDAVVTDWPRALEDALQGAATAPDEKAFRAVLRRLLAAAQDGHAELAPAGPPAPAPLAWDWIEDRLVVTAASEAIARQVEPGDAVLAIGGVPAEKAIEDAAAQVSAATPRHKRRRALAELRIPPPGQALTLTVEPFRDPGRRRDVTLRAGFSSIMDEPRPDKLAELRPGVWYADLTRLQDADWPEALKRLAGASGIVFDLRGYSMLQPDWLGHLADQTLESPQWHIPVVTRPDREEMRFERMPGWKLEPRAPYFKARRAVLADARAISYAESCLAIVEHYRLAEIVGEGTAGTNGNVNPVTLPGGYRFGFTGMKVLKQDGSRHHGVGVEPAVPAARTRAGVAAGRDEVLERALALVAARP